MELRDLRALVTVVESGSFTAAARQLGYTQSAVSQQVAALEAELGQQLVERRPVRATAAGARLADHAARILLRLDVARSELRQLDAGTEELRVDVGPLASLDRLARALHRFRAAHPFVAVTVRSVDARRALEQVAAGAAPLALVNGVSGPGEPIHLADSGLLLSSPVSEEPVAAVLPAGHPLARARAVELEALVDAPWILAPALGWDDIGPRPDIPARRGPSLLYEGTDVATLLALVAGGLGVVLLPERRWDALGDVATVPVTRPLLVHRTELLTLRQVPPSAEPLVQALRTGARG